MLTLCLQRASAGKHTRLPVQGAAGWHQATPTGMLALVSVSMSVYSVQNVFERSICQLLRLPGLTLVDCFQALHSTGYVELWCGRGLSFRPDHSDCLLKLAS